MADDDHGARIVARDDPPATACLRDRDSWSARRAAAGPAPRTGRGQRHAHAPAAGKFRAGPRLVGRRKSRGRPGSQRRGPAPNGRRCRPAGSGFRQSGADRGRFRPRRSRLSRSASALSTTSTRLSGPFGASCARLPMRQRGGIAIVPVSTGSSPRIALNSVDLPAPLRPTRPTRAPGGICAEPWSIRSRPAIRTEMSVIESMRGFSPRCRGKRNPYFRRLAAILRRSERHHPRLPR